MEYSNLQIARYSYSPKLPKILREDMDKIMAKEGVKTTSANDEDKIKALFPNTFGQREITFTLGESKARKDKLTVAVILSGGQAPGGHNVISGLYDALKKANKENNLIGFLGGPSGLTDDKCVLFNDDFINEYRNTGGFDIIGSGRTKLETLEQFKKATEVCKKHSINAIVIIGGDDSNTNAAVLAEYFKANSVAVQVIGCPKTIDGDLKNDDIETSFGFDTATKTFSELIGNIERDANSAKKYWHFIKVMGRSASHIALECALETQPNVCLISEEIEKKKMSLEMIASYVADSVNKRADKGMNFGTVIIPEGLVEFIPEVKALISEINDLLAKKEAEFATKKTPEERNAFMKEYLSSSSYSVFSLLPGDIKEQMMADRDPHGNVQVSKIESEKLISSIVSKELEKRKEEGRYKGKFNPLHHFFGYEGRCAFPSNFDADYCYALGYNAFMLIANGYTGYLSSIKNLSSPAEDWISGGMPITKMMNIERRNGEDKPVIKKALVELEGKPFKYFEERREKWASETCYLYPGAIQYFGPSSVCDLTTKTLQLESK